MYDDTDAIGCTMLILILVCLLGFGLCLVDVGITIYHEANNEQTIEVETVEAEITHLNIEAKKYYASVKSTKKDISVVVEISEKQYVDMQVGEVVVLQIETTNNTMKTDKTQYTLVDI